MPVGGMRMSTSATSGRWRSTSRYSESASQAMAATCTPHSRSTAATPSRTSAESSAITTRRARRASGSHRAAMTMWRPRRPRSSTSRASSNHSSSPRSSSASASSRTTLETKISPPRARSAIRAALTTVRPWRSSSRTAGSPVCIPIRTRRPGAPSSGSARWTSMAQRNPARALGKATRCPSPSALTSVPPCSPMLALNSASYSDRPRSQRSCPRRSSNAVEPSTSAKRTVTVPPRTERAASETSGGTSALGTFHIVTHPAIPRGARQKSQRMTARRRVGRLTTVKPASANVASVPTCSSSAITFLVVTG